MALSHAQRAELLAATLPEATEVRLELQDYLARTGMAPLTSPIASTTRGETVYPFPERPLQPNLLQ